MTPQVLLFCRAKIEVVYLTSLLPKSLPIWKDDILNLEGSSTGNSAYFLILLHSYNIYERIRGNKCSSVCTMQWLRKSIHFVPKLSTSMYDLVLLDVCPFGHQTHIPASENSFLSFHFHHHIIKWKGFWNLKIL